MKFVGASSGNIIAEMNTYMFINWKYNLQYCMMHERLLSQSLYYERCDYRFHHMSMPYQKPGDIFSNDTTCQANKLRKFPLENV